jgi:hypothetical protein
LDFVLMLLFAGVGQLLCEIADGSLCADKAKKQDAAGT